MMGAAHNRVSDFRQELEEGDFANVASLQYFHIRDVTVSFSEGGFLTAKEKLSVHLPNSKKIQRKSVVE